ncbi:hypothetical protein P168DRAFT_289554 [Aspergillus campestris IBT 28561]|uniref:SMP-LTD domain-containing protein n=1 Tax=Aspergillus campestris (strain IBT 28561) TaxID=1392248 RepID=A0A2I1D477_ASPC2|nr:uncharacterized protein P168DRAFT_289554 [Aspergillus campestris IBT 28561]PKY04670.1 hypothetical protein P168DRAFT_289554 [Aspergillus campestris IBT 28561]
MGKPYPPTQYPDLRHVLETVEQTFCESKIIVIVCLTAWAIRRLNLGFVWIIVLLAFCRTQQRVTLRRIQHAIHDELRRHHAQKNARERGESVLWLNVLLGRVWHQYERPICQRILRYINSNLARQGNDSPAEAVILESWRSIAQPLRLTKVITKSKPGSPNIILEGDFVVSLLPPEHSFLYNHYLTLLELTAPDNTTTADDEPLLDLTITHKRDPSTKKKKEHDLSVKVRTFTTTGVLRLEVDFSGPEPALHPPQVDLHEQPRMDCTIRTVSQHHFPFHFAHAVDWRRLVEMQIREGLGWTGFQRVLPMPFRLWGERFLVGVIQWWVGVQKAL